MLDPTVCRRRGWTPGTVLPVAVVLIAFGTVATAIPGAVATARRLAKADAADGQIDGRGATRKRIYAMAAAERLPVVGYHTSFPSVGFVEQARQGYHWLPVTYQLRV